MMSFAEKFKRKQQQRIEHVSNEQQMSNEIVQEYNVIIPVSNERGDADIRDEVTGYGVTHEEAKNALVNLIVSLNKYIFDRRHITRIMNAETLCRYFNINTEELREQIARIRAEN